MATEIALTGQEPLTEDALLAAAVDAVPGGLCVELRDGELWALVDPSGERVLTMFASKQIEVQGSADRLLGHATHARWWGSVSVPFGRPEPGTAIAHRLAEATGSTATVLT